MKRTLLSLISVLALSVAAYAADDVAGAVAGTVKKIDAGTKSVVVETDKGAVHTFHYSDSLVVHGAKDTAAGADDTFKGVKVGSRVAVHYTAKGADETAHEVDAIGQGGLKVAKGTVTGIDRGSKFIAVKTADGTEDTFKLTDRAAIDSGKEIGKGAEKTSKVTVYYTESAGKKIAHFFEQ